MSFADREIAAGERMQYAAIQIAIRAEELKSSCEICGELIENHSEDHLQSAYRIGNALITNNDPLVRDFDNRKQLTDILKTLWTDYNDKCRCSRGELGD